MKLLQQVFELCNKLAQNGWREMILSVTNNQLDIKKDSAEKLKEALLKPITVDRTFTGFEDYRLDGDKGIEFGSFSKSLLYHALASPKVVNEQLSYYPSIEDLDLVENFIFSTAQTTPASIGDLRNKYGNKLVVAVFAYQYRTWEGSTHRVHADMNYSRTGIARIGTSEALYDAKRRSFWVGDEDGKINVLPCRYGAFLAIQDTVSNLEGSFDLMDKQSEDNRRVVIVPIHKLFHGSECLADIPNLNLEFETFHRNEKLKRVHQENLPNTIPIDKDLYNINDFPFVIDDNTKPNFLYSVSSVNGSIIITPTNGQIVEPAVQGENFVVFNVPALNTGNRFNSSYQILAERGRKSPEYVNIRQTVPHGIRVNAPKTDIIDINDLEENRFNQVLTDGGYQAVHFVDRTCDGYVKLKELEGLDSFAAYSLITAIDFFPLVNQREIFRWNNVPGMLRDRLPNPAREAHFFQGGARPLSNGRIKANIHFNVFQSDETTTHTVIISQSHAHTKNADLVESDDSSLSYLPDTASDVFAPGWDVSMDIENNTPFNAAYGLGSPFPEDAKLCAALNSFWPAAAPDASRTFFASSTAAFDRNFSTKKPTAIPLTDEELGFYPREAQRLGIESKRGWDGEYGPFLEKSGNEEFVNYADIARSDYTRGAWEGKMHMDLLKNITTSQLIKRMEALRKCILDLLEPSNDNIVTTNLWLVSFQEIFDWQSRTDKLDNELSGKGFAFVFILPISGVSVPDGNDIKRLKRKVAKKFVCHLSESISAVQEDDKQPFVIENSNTPRVNLISHLV